MARPKKLSADEKKSARATLLMTPQLFDDLQLLATISDQSVNSLLCALVEQVVSKNRSAIDAVKATISEVAPTVDLRIDDDNNHDACPPH